MQHTDAQTTPGHAVIVEPRVVTEKIDCADLPVAEPGVELVQGEVYIDLENAGHGPFRALPGQTAGTGNCYVAQRDVDAHVWDVLIRSDAETALTLDECPCHEELVDHAIMAPLSHQE